MFYSVLLDHCIVFFNNSLPNCFLMISSLYCCLCEALRNMEFEKSSIDKDYSVNNYRSHEQCKKTTNVSIVNSCTFKMLLLYLQ